MIPNPLEDIDDEILMEDPNQSIVSNLSRYSYISESHQSKNPFLTLSMNSIPKTPLKSPISTLVDEIDSIEFEEIMKRHSKTENQMNCVSSVMIHDLVRLI